MKDATGRLNGNEKVAFRSQSIKTATHFRAPSVQILGIENGCLLVETRIHVEQNLPVGDNVDCKSVLKKN